MENLKLVSLLFLSGIVPLQASSGYGVAVSLQSPLVQETDAGTIITASFLVSNQKEEEETFSVYLDIPPDWISIPFEEPFFTLKGQETKVELIAIRVPSQALAGNYPIRYRIQGQEHPSLISEANFSVEVLKRSEIQTLIHPSPKYQVAGDIYQVTFTVINTGNTESDVEIDVSDAMNFEISLDQGPLIHLTPGESKEIIVRVKTPKTLKESIQHFLTITTQVKDDPSSLCYLSSEVEIFPKDVAKIGRYDVLPMKTVFGYGMKNDKKQLFLEQYGSGTLDEAKKKMSIFSQEFLLSTASM